MRQIVYDEESKKWLSFDTEKSTLILSTGGVSDWYRTTSGRVFEFSGGLIIPSTEREMKNALALWKPSKFEEMFGKVEEA